MKRKNKMMLTLMAVAAGILAAAGVGGWNGADRVEAAGRPVSIDSCLISDEDVVCEISTSSVPSSDDGKFYVYANDVQSDGTTGSIVAKVDAGKSVSASFPLNYNTADSNLSRKFLIAVKRNGEMIQVSDEHYITNPDVIAVYSSTRMDG